MTIHLKQITMKGEISFFPNCAVVCLCFPTCGSVKQGLRSCSSVSPILKEKAEKLTIVLMLINLLVCAEKKTTATVNGEMPTGSFIINSR